MKRTRISVSAEVLAAMEAYVAATTEDELEAAFDRIKVHASGSVQYIIVAVIQAARREGSNSLLGGVFVAGDNHGGIHMGTKIENSGQMQGVGIHGTGSATNSTQRQSPVASSDDKVEALREQIGELLTLVAKRLEDLEAAAPPVGTADLLREVMVLLKDHDSSSNTKTLDDIHQMLEQLWGDAMRDKFDKLDQFLKASGKVLPAVAKLVALATGTA